MGVDGPSAGHGGSRAPEFEAERAWAPAPEGERASAPGLERGRRWAPGFEAEGAWAPGFEGERAWAPGLERERRWAREFEREAAWAPGLADEPERVPDGRDGAAAPGPCVGPGMSADPVEGPGPALRGAIARDTGPWALRGKEGSVPSGRFALGPFDPGRRGLRALIAVVALIALVAGFLVWRSRPRPELVTPSTSTAPTVGPSGSAAPSGTIVVAVQGKVRSPGLVRLPVGSRVADAIAAAGGALPDVDLAFVNVARRLSDGELIVIGQTPPPGVGAPDASGTTGKIDLNAATVAELDTLPGIGPALAQRIVDYRTRHGAFRSVDDLRQVSGIGDAKFSEIKDLVTV